ncbi:hypothetical protein [Pelistega sp. MC2]|uniref:hypothetical protein n=1 Tax=Pelistega sp. MC2 TaxID=1720297 RepID=UPI0008D92097|nr:hypothetical protein [Pelistega sp. MC2]
MREIHLRIRNVSEADYANLKALALQLTGSYAVSSLIRYWIRQSGIKSQNKQLPKLSRSRLEIQLKNKEQLSALASTQGMSLNRFIVMLLNNYTEDTKIMSATQIQVLRESNYQLYQLGKNINQIAKALNQGKPISLTSQKLDELSKLIDTHTSKVADVICSTPTL